MLLVAPPISLSTSWVVSLPYESNEILYVDGPWLNDTVGYDYDKLGRRTATSINGFANVKYVNFEPVLGRVNQQINPLDTFTNAYVPSTSRVDYMLSNLGTSVDFGYASVLDDSYLNGIRNGKRQFVETSRFHMVQDDIGRITDWDRAFDNGALEAQTPSYDDADRLLSLLRDLPTGADTNWGYSYDSTQNRLSDSVTVGGVVQQQQTYTVNDLDQVTRVDSGGATPAFMQEIGEQLAAENKLDFTAQNAYNEQQTALGKQSLTGTFLLEPGTDFTWDDNGNLTAATVTVAGGGQFTVNYLWNTKNELRFLGVPGLLTIEYVYDALGRRIRIIQRDGQDAVTSDRYFVWEGLNLAEERTASSGPPTRQFYPQGEVRGGVKYYYTKDHLGSVREVVDASGNIVARYDYDPFGQPTQTFGTMQFDRLYTGHLYDWTAGLYLAPFRAYNPGIGRWISREPLGLDGPNPYHYVFNDPIRYSDQTGLWAGVDDLLFAGGGAAIGVGGVLLGDAFSGELSDWEDYAGAALGGAAGGEALLYTANPFIAGAAAGGVGNAVTQGLKTFSGKQCGFDFGSLALNTGLGAATGYLKGIPRIPGLNSGRGSDFSVFKQMVTKFKRGQIQNLRNQTALKMARGAFYGYAIPQGTMVGVFGSNAFGR